MYCYVLLRIVTYCYILLHVYVYTLYNYVIPVDIGGLKRIKERLPEYIEYWQIKMTIAIMMVTAGFVRPGKELTPSLASPSFSVS